VTRIAKKHVAIVTFPGSNCDHDCYHVVRHVIGAPARFVWHEERDLGNADLVILPGGFSYGDYLRCGAIARFSPVMDAVRAFAERGGPVLGICNGFQILTEAGLLPGALTRNESLRFICRDVQVRVEGRDTPFTRGVERGQPLNMPIAHAEGRYVADKEILDRLEDEACIVFRYHGENPNGSLNDVAGICSREGNVVGLMPHPERAGEAVLGGPEGRADGLALLRAAVEALA
jgi:phosphoribosylformylglycinamidine synthase